MSHTPGPWDIEYIQDGAFSITSSHNGVICSRASWNHNSAESAANARLISTAPELLEALREARQTILDLKNSRGSEAEGSDDDWVGDIDAAISKATSDN